MKENYFYEGWELPYFDKAKNFRNYQFSFFKKNIRGSVAEIGPGTGDNIQRYKKLSEKIYLYELSPNFKKKLIKKYFNKKIKIKSKNFLNEKLTFDTIIALDVMEHVRNDKRFLSKLLKSLKKNGNLIVNVPAFPILFSDFDKDVHHLKRYKKYFFNKNINQSFKVKMFYYDSIGFFLSLISKIFTKNYKKNFRYKILFWDKLIPISKLLDRLLLNLFGKSLIVIAKKK
tara:strand:+ start:335 stop:1021 length:687 start_codon:yes stop_codon:yes gene_type:complete